ncbi:anthranilate synthase component I family protein [Cohnella pontilimi]|uniref:anthranilate synthase component I family protein n=1 Tax=Cohnella pontilimi TaxID=2564100 RepID=UPI001FE8E45F|nr:anthranilate synthase component I family protein [Cohnella pontilimi]
MNGSQWHRWNGEYSMLPFVRKLDVPEGGSGLLPALWDGLWADASEYACVLESGKGGRYTIVGARPVSVLTGRGPQVQVMENRDDRWVQLYEAQGEPIHMMRDWLNQTTAPKLAGVPDCIGGVLGFWSYDMARHLEKIPESAVDDLQLPDFLYQRYTQLWIADHRENAIYAAVHTPISGKLDTQQLERKFRQAEETAAQMEQSWIRWRETADSPELAAKRRAMLRRIEEQPMNLDVEKVPGLQTSLDKHDFMQAVERVREYIAQGDVFQVNLSLRQSRPSAADPEELYEWLRLVNPSPYMGCLRTPEFSLVSASPELLVKMDGGRLTTRPIAGTRRRGRTPDEDRAMEDELLTNEKERAEHVMLVDLERNDLGRVAAYGSVKVPELLTVEKYSHVMHLVSQVEARLASGKDALDVMAAVFPGGTITGAPKIRTMEIIEELEPVRRGAYTGAMGWIDYSGDMEFNIVIRTILWRDGLCHIQAGAGIVIDSDPEREFYECLNKAKALWTAEAYARGTPNDSGDR